jgi:hypothetical protein
MAPAEVSLQAHDDLPFRVSGILAPTGTPVDQQLYISLAAHEAIHIGWESGTRMPGTGIDSDQGPGACRQAARARQPHRMFLGLE